MFYSSGLQPGGGDPKEDHGGAAGSPPKYLKIFIKIIHIWEFF